MRRVLPTRDHLVALLAGVLAATVVAAGVWVVDRGEQARMVHQQRSHLLERLSLLRVRLESHLNQVIASARALSVVYATHPRLNAAEFRLLAREIVELQPSIINVGLIRGTVLSEVYPIPGNEAAVGLDIRQNPAMWPAFQRMMEQRRTVIAGPVPLVQGGTGIIVRIPVHAAEGLAGQAAGDFLGAVSIPLDARAVLAQADLDGADQDLRLALRGRDGLGAAGETFHGDATLFATDAVRQTIQLPGGSWEIAAVPRERPSSKSLLLIRGLGALLVLVSGSGVWVLVRSRQRQARDEQRVLQAHRRLEQLLQALPDLLFEVDDRGTILGVWAGGREELLLAPPRALIGRTLADLMPPDAHMGTMAAIEQALRDGRSEGQRILLPLPQGEMWFELSVARIDDESGPRLLALSRDVSARVRDEDELRIAATAFQSHEPLMITDAAHRIMRVNGAFTESTGYTADEVVGRTPAVLQSDRHDSRFHALLRERLLEGGRWEGEVWNRRRSGDLYPAWLSITGVRDKRGHITHYVGSVVDVTQRKRDEAHIHHLAFHDALTGLPNRRLLMERVHHALALAARGGQHAALLFIDLDNFKTLNDTKGHLFGDELLRAVAERLRPVLREVDTVARLGGDEFVVLLEALGPDEGAAAAVARSVGEKLRLAVARPMRLQAVDVAMTCSIGVRLFDHQAEVDDLLRHADTAMYAAKGAGRNAVCFFDPAMEDSLSRRAELEADLRAAVQHDQLLLHLQPQVNADGLTTGAEALLRWRHPRRGLLPPQDFIGLAEDTGLIHELGEWVLAEACRRLQAWAAHPGRRHLVLSVNVSPRQLHDPSFHQRVERLVKQHQVPPGRLKLELTESSLLDGSAHSVAQLQGLRDLGLAFSLDDFGTGYSSLQYLKRLPLDELKIDRSFTRDIVEDVNDQAIVRTILAMARSLGLGVIAEGVETPAQQQVLRDAGCGHWQGYLFGRPQPIEEFEAALT